jgi:hypothetical protein
VRDLLHYLLAHHQVVHPARHLWVTTFDGEGWLSAVDAVLHILRRS